MTADWVMVIITGIYVVATIFICYANIKSANASKQQLNEMQRQYTEANRPVIETEFHYIRRNWYTVRFVNHGNMTAQRVKIKLEQSFIDSLPDETIKSALKELKNKECIIGVGQYYELFIGSNKLSGNPQMKPLIGTVEYAAQGETYSSDLFVDLKHYMTFYSTTTDEEELLKSMKNVSDELKNIRQILSAQKTTAEVTDQNEETV